MNKKKEQIKELLLELLPQPVSSGKELVAGDPPEVVAKLSDKGLVIAPYRAEWTNPYTLKVAVSDADLVDWDDLVSTDEQLQTYLFRKIESAREARKATLKICSLCHKTTPPEFWMEYRKVCHSCASDKLGVVF